MKWTKEEIVQMKNGMWAGQIQDVTISTWECNEHVPYKFQTRFQLGKQTG